MPFCHEFPGAAKLQPKAIGNATEKRHTENTEILLPRIHAKIGGIRGQVFSVFSVQKFRGKKSLLL
jgi:hypothetical protein